MDLARRRRRMARRLIFELLGDLYRVPIAGGDATRITDGTPYDAQPRVSPDGKWIAFISDRNGSDNLWIAKIDGTEPRKLSSESQDAVISPAWTPDSQYVIASMRGDRRHAAAHVPHQRRQRHRRSRVLRRPAARGGAGTGGGAAGPTRLGASVSPDGRYLFVAQAGTGTGLARWQVARLDMRSGDADVITQAEGGGMRPLVSPDGKLVVYATRYETKTGLRVRNLETGADRWLKWPITPRRAGERRHARAATRSRATRSCRTARSSSITNDGRIERVNVDDRGDDPGPVQGEGVARRRPGPRVPVPGAAGTGAREADPGSAAVARRQAARRCRCSPISTSWTCRQQSARAARRLDAEALTSERRPADTRSSRPGPPTGSGSPTSPGRRGAAATSGRSAPTASRPAAAAHEGVGLLHRHHVLTRRPADRRAARQRVPAPADVQRVRRPAHPARSRLAAGDRRRCRADRAGARPRPPALRRATRTACSSTRTTA